MWLTLWACRPDLEPAKPEVVDPEPTTPVPVDPETSCDPVDVSAFAVDPMASQPLGRRFDVSLGAESGAVVACTLASAPAHWYEWVPLQADWRYLDHDDPGLGWTDPVYDDSGWADGKAPFGREDLLATEIPLLSQVTWLRTTFEVASPQDAESVRVAYRRDDGVVVYVNGTEVLRDNVPTTTPVTGPSERTLQPATIDPAVLVAGTNTVAVELHQAEGSTDLGFDLRISALVGGAPTPEVLLVEDDAAATEHQLELYGFLAGATYACEARSTACDGATADASVTTEALTVPIPPMAMHPGGAAPAWGTYTLFNHQRPCIEDHSNRLFIVDPDGQVRWHYEIDLNAGSTIDFESQFLPDGTVLWGGAEKPEGSPHIVGLDGETRYVATYPGSDGDIYHHAIEGLANGRIVGLVTSPVTSGVDYWQGFGIVEHDPATGEVTWRWEAQEAYDRGELPGPAIDVGDPYHANGLVAVDDADGPGFYVALLEMNDIIRIDRETREITWHLGPTGDFALVDSNGSPLPLEDWFDYSHGLNVFDGRVFLYDNGWAFDRSRAVAMTLDSTAWTASLDWAWAETGWSEPRWGDVDELPGGTGLIDMAHAYCQGASLDHPGALVEVSEATGEVGWRLDMLDVDDSSYRASRINGCDWFPNSRYCPDVAAKVEALEPRAKR